MSSGSPSGTSTFQRICHSVIPDGAGGVDDAAVDRLEPGVGAGEDRRDREHDERDRRGRADLRHTDQQDQQDDEAERRQRPRRARDRDSDLATRPVWPMSHPTGIAMRRRSATETRV